MSVATTGTEWIRVSREHPCPVCERPDWCMVASDGSAAICPRIESEKQAGDGGWLHRLDDSGPRHFAPPKPEPRKPKLGPEHWTSLARFYFENAAHHREELAESLGVSVEALTRLGVGYTTEAGGWWSFPEKNAQGEIIGINRRFRDGSKKRCSGSRSGLTYAKQWDAGGTVLLVEGGSDVAAGLSIGLTVIGRPSNCGGVNLLAELLRDIDRDRAIVVLAERDRKPDGLWPGRDGAQRTAESLTRTLGRFVGWAFPPQRTKDLRGWMTERS